ncbi:MAG: carboxypeptidase-like regulatory domain-containing protein [Parabacteroides sp.]|nr:carboxypeptidase-like regulatory domain-containing protein [Parabacteroides sp.]
MENRTISQVIKEIEKQSEFIFVYNVNDINLNKRVSVKFKDRSINEVLEVLFNNNALGYRITDRHIALYVKDMVQQQASQKISGIISDVNGDPVIGANIFVVGTSNGTVSDMNGRFEISAPVGTILKISYIGYLDKEVKIVSGKTAYDITIQEDNQTLDEVIVVGYGSQKKSNITGAVVSVKPDEFKNKGMGVTDILSGRVSGVDVTKGRIIIRGQASINDMNPLWIVDGMPGGGGGGGFIKNLNKYGF